MNLTKTLFRTLLMSLTICVAQTTLNAQFPRFKVLAFFNCQVEPAHVQFANDAIQFFSNLTIGNGFVFDTTSNIDDLNDLKLKDYQLVMMLNDYPHNMEQQEAFKRYMENGGGWYGFHVAAYNDASTNCPWMLDFLGGGVFYRNNWPPMPAKLIVDDMHHPVTKAMPKTFIAPINEWYQWKPSPRERKNIKILVSLSPDNYPFGLKDIVTDGDFPVVWTNTNYRMIYLNMGHGDRIFNDPTQNMLIISALRWVIATNKTGNVFGK